jgi:hypothetical protein
MKRRPIFLWVFSELLQDCRWHQTYLASLPIELLMKIVEMKWKMERDEAKQKLENYFHLKSIVRGRIRDLRTSSYFYMNWVTPNRVFVTCTLKWGLGYVRKDLRFSKSLNVASTITLYDRTNVNSGLDETSFGSPRHSMNIEDNTSDFEMSMSGARSSSSSMLASPFY